MCSDICFLRLPAFKEFFDLDKAVGRGGTIFTLQLFHTGWQENKNYVLLLRFHQCYHLVEQCWGFTRLLEIYFCDRYFLIGIKNVSQWLESVFLCVCLCGCAAAIDCAWAVFCTFSPVLRIVNFYKGASLCAVQLSIRGNKIFNIQKLQYSINKSLCKHITFLCVHVHQIQWKTWANWHNCVHATLQIFQLTSARQLTWVMMHVQYNIFRIKAVSLKNKSNMSLSKLYDVQQNIKSTGIVFNVVLI